MITVKDVWRGVLPHGTELLAGGGGLERRVEWATALRTRPPAFDAIKGGEMAFVPVARIRMLDERLDLTDVMRSLAEKGGVAIAVVGDVRPDALVLADRLLLPLLRLPDATHVADAQQATVRFILDQRTLLHERQQELHRELMELALAGAGTGAIVDRLAALCGAAAAWQDADGRVRHAAGSVPDLDAALAADMPAVTRWADSVPATAADPPVREFPAGPGELVRVVAPVLVRDGVAGFVSVVGPDQGLGQLARLAVSRAAAACAVELGRERAVLAAREELEGELLESLISGGYASETAARQRAQRLGVTLDGDSAVLLAREDGPPGASPRFRRDRLLAAAQAWARRQRSGSLVGMHQGMVAVLALAGDGEVQRLAGDLHRSLRGALEAPVSVGVGRPRPGLPGVRASHREAEQALSMGTRLFGPDRVIPFAELGLYRLLFALHGHQELAEFLDDQVGRLIEYDARTGAGLMQTLDAFFRCHGSPTETASRLHLHRNTVLYRLRRIEEIGHLSLADPATRLNLHLCLRAREVMQVAG